MAYPFIPALSFREFRTRLEKEFGCQFKQDYELKNGKGKSYPVSCFVRIVDGREIQCPITIDDEEEIVTPTVLRMVCSRLELDPKDFGYDLGWVNSD